MSDRLPWFITWTENEYSSYRPTLGFATGDEAYRMAGAIADRKGIVVKVFPPNDGEAVQPSLDVAPKGGSV